MLDMTKEQKVLLGLVRAGISGSPYELIETEVDWEQVIAESRSQAVLLLACNSAVAIKDAIPTELFERWKIKAIRSMQNNMKVQKAQRDMTAILEAGKYPYVILKGSASAYYYPDSELRALGDVDFLIDPKMKEELTKLFLDQGYSQHLENHICHRVFKKPGAHLEMHFEPSGIPNGEQGDAVRRFFEGAVYKSIRVDHGDDAYDIPEPYVHGMILALHMQHHQVSEGLGLRHLCDWACFVQKTAGDSFWDGLLAWFHEIGLLTYVRLITKTCSLYMGIPLPAWAEDADGQVCEEIIKDIFTGGNFGRKDKVRSKSAMMVSNHGKDGTGHSKFYYLYETLHMSSVQHNPTVRDHKIRWFIEDCKRAVIYIIKTIRGERVSLVKMMPEADKRKKIYEKFHLFETKSKVGKH